MENNDNPATVTSVFRSGENITTERKFTEKWVELVNALEKAKSLALGKESDP